MGYSGKISMARRATTKDPPRREGLLHPRAYIWVIDNQFKAGDAPDWLLEKFGAACRAWAWYATETGPDGRPFKIYPANWNLYIHRWNRKR